MKFLTTLVLLVSWAGLSGQTTIDFTNPATPTYGTDAQKNEGGVMVMWGGDANQDGKVITTEQQMIKTIFCLRLVYLRPIISSRYITKVIPI